MNKAKFQKVEDPLLINTLELKSYLSSGRETAIKIGILAGARIQVGKRVLWNVEKIKNYIDEISE